MGKGAATAAPAAAGGVNERKIDALCNVLVTSEAHKERKKGKKCAAENINVARKELGLSQLANSISLPLSILIERNRDKKGRFINDLALRVG